MSKQSDIKSTLIELIGNFALLNGKIITLKEAKKMKKSLSDEVETDDYFNSLLESSNHTFLGAYPDFQVHINGSEFLNDMDDIYQNCIVTSYPGKTFILNEKDEAAFIAIERERGVFQKLEINGEFDVTKLTFSVHVLELPNGNDETLVVAQYDGKNFEYDSPDQLSVSFGIYDFFNNEILVND